MAGPLIEMLQGLQSRRQRRRSGWGGGDAPGMRDMINPLDSQDMADRSQGVDISSSLPSTRLEASISEPAAESFATSRLPRPAAPSVAAPAQVAADFDQPAPRSSPFRTAAGSNAAADPISTQQCPGGVCPTGPSRGLNAADYGINLSPGETLVRVNEQPSGSPAPMGGAQQPAGQAGSPAAATTTVGAPQPDAWSGFTSSFKAFADDPKSANWVALAKITAEQSEQFNRLANLAPDIATKHFYRKQAIFMGMESINSVKASIMQSDAARREALADRSLNQGTLSGQSQDIMGFLTADNPEATPEYRAALFTGRSRQLSGQPGFTSQEEMNSDPEYQNALGVVYAADISRLAVGNAAAGGNPWGTEDDRKFGRDVAWAAASKRYGQMPFEQAQAEILQRFEPSYRKALSQVNAAKPESERRPQAEINAQSYSAAQQLWSNIYHDQADRQAAQAAAQPQQPAAHPYLRGTAPATRSPEAEAPAPRGQSLKRNTEWMRN